MVGIGYYILNIQNNQKNQQNALRNQELSIQSQELTRKAQEQQLETRQAQIFMQMYDHSHNDQDFIKALQILLDQKITSYDEFQRKREEEEFKIAFTRVGFFFEGLGVLVKEGYIDIKLVALLMTGLTRRARVGVNL